LKHKLGMLLATTSFQSRNLAACARDAAEPAARRARSCDRRKPVGSQFRRLQNAPSRCAVKKMGRNRILRPSHDDLGRGAADLPTHYKINPRDGSNLFSKSPRKGLGGVDPFQEGCAAVGCLPIPKSNSTFGERRPPRGTINRKGTKFRQAETRA